MATVRFSNKISAVISSVVILFLKKWRRNACKLNLVEQFSTLTTYQERKRSDKDWLSKMYIVNECAVQVEWKICEWKSDSFAFTGMNISYIKYDNSVSSSQKNIASLLGRPTA